MAQVRAKVDGFVTAAWLGLSNYRDADVDAFIARVVPSVVSGQRTVAQLTNAYLAQMAGLAFAATVTPERLVLAEVTGSVLRGVDMALEYRRPAVDLYTALSRGSSMTDAVDVGLGRAKSLAATDLQLAKTHTVAKSQRVIGYKRTLSGLENCDLCPLAASNFYTRGDLMPIHPHCDCGVVPVFSKLDEAETTTLDPSVAVRVHGELGPVLTRADQNFTSESDLSH